MEVLCVVVWHTGGFRQLGGLRGSLFRAPLRRLGQVVDHAPDRFDAARKGAAIFDGNRIKAVANISGVFRLKLQDILQESEQARDRLGDFDATCSVPRLAARLFM